jgi:dihydrolipoamide dehydrogenase
MQRKDDVVKKLRTGIAGLLKSHGVTVLAGTGSLAARKTVRIEKDGAVTEVAAKKVIVATGSESAMPSFIPFDGMKIIESKAALSLAALPNSIIIIGGGVIGCEFASMLTAFGVKVTVIEMLDRLLPLEDKDISAALTKVFDKAGITVHTGAKAEKIAVTPAGVTCEIAGQAISAEMMLVAIGRAMNTKGLGLEEAGVKIEKGAVIVDEHLQTTAAGVYAIGDITAKLQLAHVASAQGIVAAEHATGLDSRMDYAVVPNCIFTTPEIGTVGMSEAKAAERGEIRVGTFHFAGLGKAMAMGETTGFCKIVADAKTDAVLGVQIIGPHATDLVAEAALAIKLQCTARELAKTIHAHPTLAEGLMEAAHAVHGECIHAPRKR